MAVLNPYQCTFSHSFFCNETSKMADFLTAEIFIGLLVWKIWWNYFCGKLKGREIRFGLDDLNVSVEARLIFIPQGKRKWKKIHLKTGWKKEKNGIVRGPQYLMRLAKFFACVSEEKNVNKNSVQANRNYFPFYFSKLFVDFAVYDKQIIFNEIAIEYFLVKWKMQPSVR